MRAALMWLCSTRKDDSLLRNWQGVCRKFLIAERITADAVKSAKVTTSSLRERIPYHLGLVSRRKPLGKGWIRGQHLHRLVDERLERQRVLQPDLIAGDIEAAVERELRLCVLDRQRVDRDRGGVVGKWREFGHGDVSVTGRAGRIGRDGEGDACALTRDI